MFTDRRLQNLYSPDFEPIYLPPGPELADYVHIITVKISDTYGATTVVILRAKIGKIDCVVIVFVKYCYGALSW